MEATEITPDTYSNWGDDWVERCDNLLDEKERLEHDLGLRWGQRNDAVDALRALLSEYEKVVQIAISAGFRSHYDMPPAYTKAKELVAGYDPSGTPVVQHDHSDGDESG